VVSQSGKLADLKVEAGDPVRKGQVMAVLVDPELDNKLATAREDKAGHESHKQALEDKKRLLTDMKERVKIDKDLAYLTGKIDTKDAEIKALEGQKQALTIYSPQDGVVGTGPRPTDVGKYFVAHKDQEGAPPLFTVIAPTRLRVCVPVETADFNRLRENLWLNARDHKRSGGAKPKELRATLRVHGLVSDSWGGEVLHLDESESKTVPIALSSKGGGPVAVKAQPGPGGALYPQTQHYMVYVDIQASPEDLRSIHPGVMAQVKIHCRHETCIHWLWRTINNTFDLRLL
jgi:hypothetical protein